jgi:hypothetical protein
MDDSPAPFIVFKPCKPERYQLALELVGLVHDILEHAGSRYHVKDRLDRNATAIAMQLATADEDPGSVRWRTYRRVLDLVIECGTLLDIMARQGCPPTAELARAHETVAKLQELLAPLAFRGN